MDGTREADSHQVFYKQSKYQVLPDVPAAHSLGKKEGGGLVPDVGPGGLHEEVGKWRAGLL